MRFLSRVVWSEGMHLGPHHFQTQSRYFEDTLWFLHANARQYPWGIIQCSLDQAAARNGTAVLTSASGIMPDGLIFDIPDCDSLPPPSSLSSLFSPTDSSITLYLQIPARADFGLVCDLEGGTITRYGASPRMLRDETTNQDERAVSFARKNLVLSGQTDDSANTVSFAIARIFRDGKGGFVYDSAFIPPCLRIAASDRLVTILRHLLEAIEEKIVMIRRDKRSVGKLELGTSALDVANYWFLHCLCSAVPALRDHLLTRVSHPEDIYRDLARLAGALSTFSLDSVLEDIPQYTHNDLTSTFGRLDSLIRQYLDTIVPPNSVTLVFRKTEPYFFIADITDERCLRRSRWILGIRSSAGESTLLRQVPRLIKVCSGRGVVKLVKIAMDGLGLIHLPVPPSTISAQADMQYFSLSLEGPCWQDILNTRQVGVYVPIELGDAIFELTIVTESNT